MIFQNGASGRVIGIFAVASLVLAMPRDQALGRTQYETELNRLLSDGQDADVSELAKRLGCRVCHPTEPADEKLNVFGKEFARAIGRETDIKDRREIQVALHRAVFLLRNRQPAAQSSGDGRNIVRKRYVGTVLKEKSQITAYEMPLSDVLDVLAENHGITIQFDKRGFQRAGISTDQPVSLVVSEVPLQSLLQFLLGEHELTYEIKDNAVLVRPDEPAKAKTAPPPDAVDLAALAKTLRKYVGKRIRVTDLTGSSDLDILLRVQTSQKGELEALSLYSSRSSSKRRYFSFEKIKEIRHLNTTLFQRVKRNDPIAVRSRQLEAEMLQRERIRRRERLQSAFRRRGGIGQNENSVRDRRPERPYEEELGDASDVVNALGSMAMERAATQGGERRPVTPTEESSAPRETAAGAPSTATEQLTATRERMKRKRVLIRYQTTAGNPPRLRYGTRIRYETQDPEDAKMQKGSLNPAGECELSVPEDVTTIRVFTTPFGGSEGTHQLAPSGPSTVVIPIDGS